MKRVFILGGTVAQARQAAREAGLRLEGCRFIGREDSCRGALQGSRLWRVGTWRQRRDLADIERTIRPAQMIEWTPGQEGAE